MSSPAKLRYLDSFNYIWVCIYRDTKANIEGLDTDLMREKICQKNIEGILNYGKIILYFWVEEVIVMILNLAVF